MFNNSKSNLHLTICTRILVFVGLSLLFKSTYDYLFITHVRIDGFIYTMLTGVLAIGASVTYGYSKKIGAVVHTIVFLMTLPFLTVISEIQYDFEYMFIFTIPIMVFCAAIILVQSPNS